MDLFGEVLLIRLFGLDIMESRFAALGECVYFQDILAACQPASAGVISGALLAFLVQSGSVAVGIIIALAASGTIGFEQSAAMVLGEVLGTAGLAGNRRHWRDSDGACRRTVLFYGSCALVSVGIVLVFFPCSCGLFPWLPPVMPRFFRNMGILSRPGVWRLLHGRLSRGPLPTVIRYSAF